MTSLFRRSNSNGSARSNSSTQELNNSRPVRRLEFNQAMEDFKTMFPNMEYDIIECVLRANNGAVDATIDQLLQMNLDDGGYDDSSDSDDSIPPEVIFLFLFDFRFLTIFFICNCKAGHRLLKYCSVPEEQTCI